jgi:hypothetical protein
VSSSSFLKNHFNIILPPTPGSFTTLRTSV